MEDKINHVRSVISAKFKDGKTHTKICGHMLSDAQATYLAKELNCYCCYWSHKDEYEFSKTPFKPSDDPQEDKSNGKYILETV